MPRLTADLIAEAPQFTNAVKDWELDLRGNKITVIENLGSTLDQFDAIDFSDNEIRKLEGFPLLKRLKNVLISNNKVCRIGEGLEGAVPNLETLVLTNNALEELSDIDPLAPLQSLTYLSLLRNPVIHKPGYRYYVISTLPQLRVLDFKRIKQKERERATQMFARKKNEKEKAKKAHMVMGVSSVSVVPAKPSGPSASDMARIREAIAMAKSLEEVQQLEVMLKAGQLPGGVVSNSSQIVENEMET